MWIPIPGGKKRCPCGCTEFERVMDCSGKWTGRFACMLCGRETSVKNPIETLEKLLYG